MAGSALKRRVNGTRPLSEPLRKAAHMSAQFVWSARREIVAMLIFEVIKYVCFRGMAAVIISSRRPSVGPLVKNGNVIQFPRRMP